MPNPLLKKKVLKYFTRIALPIVCLLVLNSFSNPPKTYKLLLYATFEDSLKLQSGDTNLINGNICIKLRVDTVDMANLVKDLSDKISPQPNNWYLYKGHYILLHVKDQLFDLSEYQMVKNFELTSFEMLQFGNWNQGFTSNSNCLTDAQKKAVKDCWKLLMSQPKDTQNQFLLLLFKVVNKSSKKTLDIPGLTFKITKK
jgi:hypothetical protein